MGEERRKLTSLKEEPLVEADLCGISHKVEENQVFRVMGVIGVGVIGKVGIITGIKEMIVIEEEGQEITIIGIGIMIEEVGIREGGEETQIGGIDYLIR